MATSGLSNTSALGQSRHFGAVPLTSGLHPTAAMLGRFCAFERRRFDRASIASGRPRLHHPALHRQLPLLVCPALDCGCLAMPRDHSHSLVNPGDHVVRRAALQECDAVLAANRQDAVARRLHFHWVRLAWNREVAERKT